MSKKSLSGPAKAGFRRIKTRESWSRRKKMPNGMTAIMEFWDPYPEEPFDYGIWIALIPPGKFPVMAKYEPDIVETGDGSMDHLPFFIETLKDFIAASPGKIIVAGAEDSRREELYRKILPRYGFYEEKYGIGEEPWAMVLRVPKEEK